MKRITLSLTMALGCLMTTQSFGFDLLDRMMGKRGCGCDTICCEAPHAACDPVCGAEQAVCEPACGCEAACPPACGCETACQPACGCETACCKPRRPGLLQRLFSHHRRCCDDPCCDDPCQDPGCYAVAPGCGCEDACPPACGCEPACCQPRRVGLLDRLFGRCHKQRCCDAIGCDAGCCHGAPSASDVPEAPEPVADPSASYQSKRRVVQASARYVR